MHAAGAHLHHQRGSGFFGTQFAISALPLQGEDGGGD